jgi:NAD(P)H dehydrogenase (quinone)
LDILVVLAHPKKGSFNHAIAETATHMLKRKGHRVIFHDLYQENFDPVLPYNEIHRKAELDQEIEKYCQELKTAKGIIIIHPNWWGQPPAILKGWIDRVIRAGVAYKFVEGDQGEGIPVGLLKATKALVFNTSNTQQEREMKIFGDPLETLWKNCIFGLCGLNNFHRKTYRIIVNSTSKERKKWLEDVKTTVNVLF